MNNLEALDNTEKKIVIDSDCIRKKSNWVKSEPHQKLDSDSFDPKLLLKDIERNSPKLAALLSRIKQLDGADEKKHGKKFKHFIFCDVRSSGSGSRMIAAAFIANGYTMGYKALKKGEKNEESPKPQQKVRPDTPRPSDRLEMELPKSLKMMEMIEEEDSESEDEIDNNKKTPKSNSEKIRTSSLKGGNSKTEKRFQKIELLSSNALKKTKGNNFYLLSSVDVYDQPINVATKKQILANYNARPSNVHGEEVRFIIMDSGFKEGIDLFDVKYVHIFEPPVNGADLKQVIGRGTRTCGQKGLLFDPKQGWPLHVFVYDISIPRELQDKFQDAHSAFDYYLKSLNMDMKLMNFSSDLEKIAIRGAVDYKLNKAVHEFSIMHGGGPKVPITSKAKNVLISGAPILVNQSANTNVTLPSGMEVSGMEVGNMTHQEMTKYIDNYFSTEAWTDVKMENLCDDSAGPKTKGGAKLIDYTPTQRFVKKYFTPQAPVNGMLLWHSTGTGKTCSAIAAASSSFARQGYTILWVTRTTLKNDIWKNMFDLICNEEIRRMVSDGQTIPADHAKRMKLLSDAWKIRPISYKQFSNLVSKGNSYYQRLVNMNGSVDPLRKTLLIIDEAHKLYGGGDLSSIERPDMKALHASLMNSYAVSGRLSVRLLLMTATPITENPMELIKLVNLCKPMEQQISSDFPLFSQRYLKEDGTFSEAGSKRFLNNIAGHISYLNREKDARQFAQPKIEEVMVTMIKNVSDVKDLDKKMNREVINKEILALKEKIDKEAANIDDDFKDLESSRFFELRDICEEFDGAVKKGCMKIANANIRALIGEAKEHIKDIKDKIKEIKDELKSKSEYRKQVLTSIKERYERNPQKLIDFQNSVYFALKYGCTKTVKQNKTVEQMIAEHPEVQGLETQITIFDDKISSYKFELNVMLEKHRIRIKELRQMIKHGELNQLETFVIKDAIKSTQVKYKSTRKLRKEQIAQEKKGLRKDRSKLVRKLQKKQSTMKKDILEDIKERKIDKKERKKEQQRLRKTMRKQGRIREEFKEGVIKDLVKKYKTKTEKEFRDAKRTLEEEVKRKEAEKETKRIEREKERQVKRIEREKERETKRRMKEVEKTRKKREKEELRKSKKARKTRT